MRVWPCTERVGPQSAELTQFDAAKAANQLPSLESLAGGFSEEADRANLSYTEAFSVVNFMIQKYGRAKMTALLLALKNGETIDQGLNGVYTFDTNGLENAWRASIGAASITGSANATPVPTPTEVPTIIPVGAAPMPQPEVTNVAGTPGPQSTTTVTPTSSSPAAVSTPVPTTPAIPLAQRLGINRDVLFWVEVGLACCLLVILVVAVPVIVTTRRHGRAKMKPSLKILSGLLVLAFLLLACQVSGTVTPTPSITISNSATSTPTTAPLTYVNQESGVSFKYPCGWTTQTPAAGSQALMGFMSPDQTVVADLYVFQAASTDTPESSIATLSSSVLTGLTLGKTISDAALSRSDGSPAWSWVVTATGSGAELEINMTAIISGPRLYFILIFGPTQAYDSYANDVSALLDGVTFQAPVVNGVNRNKALFLSGGESTNPVRL